MRFVLLWSAMLGGLALLLAVWWQDALPNGLLAGAAGAAAVLGLLAWRPREHARVIPDVSPGTVVLAFGLAALLAADVLGEWLLYLGLGLTALGAAAVARELAVQRRRR